MEWDMPQYGGPTFDAMMPQLFQAIKELGGSGTIQEIDAKTIELLDLPEEIRNYPHGTTNSTEVEYRLAWARSFMKKVGILDNSTRGIWALTPQGFGMKEIDPSAIVREVRRMRDLSSAPHVENNDGDDDLENDGIDVPEEIQDWRVKAKNTLLNLSPDAFERLTQRLLRESGFTQVKVTGRTGDGGIDGTGIVKLNGIISFHMLFQCKRYQGTVGAGEMRDFRGAMVGRADKGLFITTGRFTDAALKEANRAGTTPIDTMDGDELIEKLKDLQLGIIPRMEYQVDEAWFSTI